MHLCICLHCPRNQRFQQGEISGAKSSRSAVKYVLRRTSTYQHVPAWNQYVRENVPSCTALYFHNPPCTSINSFVLPKVRIGTYSYVLLVICLCQYVLVCTAMRKFPKVRTGMYYRRVHNGTCRYVQVCTAINQVYRIPDILHILHILHIMHVMHVLQHHIL